MSNITDNRLNAVLSAADITAIQEAMAIIAAKLPIISLTDAQRKSMNNIDVDNKIFAEDMITQISLHGPGILPPYISAANMQTDLKLFEQADAIDSSLRQLQQRVKDIKQVAGEEVYAASLVAYRLFESASQAGVPNAKTAYDAISPRFAKRGRKADNTL